MKNLNVYLTFPGNCEEALNFYKECLGGEIVSIQKFGDSPMEAPESEKNKVMHATFKSDGVFIMASDSLQSFELNQGNNVTLSLNLDTPKEQDVIFNKLSEGGKVTMALQDTFWGAKFGMLTDKFSINWMLNCENTK